MKTPARIALGLVPPALLLTWGNDAFAPLTHVASTFVDLVADGSLLRDSLSTVSRALYGLILGALAGLVLGAAMAISRPVERLAGPLFHALRQVPLLGWLPLIGLWLGNGDEAKLLIVGLAAFYPTVLASFEGLAHVEKRYHEVASLYGFDWRQRFVNLLLPAAAPLILTGLSQALAFAWIATIGSELLLGAESGLGATMSLAQAQQRPDVILVLIVLTGLVGFTLNHLLGRIRRALLLWQPAYV